MNKGTLMLFFLLVAVVLLLLLVVIFQHYKTRKILDSLNQMLDSALAGSFVEHRYDESLLSLVESRMNQYLTAASISARNLTIEKEKIKELLADISHQTKTPIANILLYAQLLKEQDLSEEGSVYTTILIKQIEKLNFLIDSLVKLSRLEIGVFALHQVSNSIFKMVEEVARQFESKAEKKEIFLTVKAADISAVFDYKWTTEALCNLVDNAIKYTQAGGSIEISVKEYDLFCRIDVTDTGLGILEQEQAKIFTRFYRSPAVSAQEGVGIGLYLARQIVSEQGGYVKVTSFIGSGSIFSMFLPR